MKDAWESLLASRAARWAEERLLDFGDAAAERTAALRGEALCPLPDLTVLSASGGDAGSFLQGQLSADVMTLKPGDSRLAAYCTPKGRMLALFRVIRRADGYWLLLPREIAGPVTQRLRMFVMRSKVELREDGDLLVLGLCGEAGARQISAAPPRAIDAGIELGGGALVRVAGESPRYVYVAPASAVAEALKHAAMPLTGPDAWRLLDIRAGLPQVLAGAQEAFVPQMANLDLLGGISFTKGCYPGQEIVARMHYLGSLKRRMYRLEIGLEHPPGPGTAIRDNAETLVGELVMAAMGPAGVEGLAVLQIDRADDPGLQVGGMPVKATPPPYPLSPDAP